MDGTGTERKVSGDLTHMRNLKNLTSQKLRAECWLPETRENIREGVMGKR
jgi:hypothetical protein